MTPVFTPSLPQLLTTRQVSEAVGVAEITLKVWRREGRGPRFIRAGKAVRYEAADVSAWLQSQKCG